MDDLHKHIISIENGLASCRRGAKILIDILEKEIDSSDDRVKLAVETKKITAMDYFHILKIVKTQTDKLHALLEENGELDSKIEAIEQLFYYLDGAYDDGISAIKTTLDHLLLAIEKEYDDTIVADKLKSITQSKRIAADDYFFLLEFIKRKEVEKSSLHIVQKVVDDETIYELNTGEERERRIGYAEQFAT